MRKMVSGGTCAACKRTSKNGAFWATMMQVLDFGNGLILEPNTSEPVRCDDCELLANLADPEYRRLCGPMADAMEREAISNGGRKPPALENR
jgi:hypothetical protein